MCLCIFRIIFTEPGNYFYSKLEIFLSARQSLACLCVHIVNEGGNNINLGLWYIVVIAKNNKEHLMIIHI